MSCDTKTGTAASNLAQFSAQIRKGRQVYNRQCYFCHGYNGDAETLAARVLDPPPRRLLGAASLDRAAILQTLMQGRSGTAMKSFAAVLDDEEIEAVAAFVETVLVDCGLHNTAYHIAENGWPNHKNRYGLAYPFVHGDVAYDLPIKSLSAELQQGRALFLSGCVSCHDGRAQESKSEVGQESAIAPVTLPAAGSVRQADEPATEDHSACRREQDGLPTAQPQAPLPETAGPGGASKDPTPNPLPHDDDPCHHEHEHHEDGEYERDYYLAEDAEQIKPPTIAGLTPTQTRGERLYQDNCAICHAADGTARNWIGRFLDPSPPDMTTTDFQRDFATPEALRRAIAGGVVNSSMPAFASVLEAHDIGALVAYIERAFIGSP